MGDDQPRSNGNGVVMPESPEHDESLTQGQQGPARGQSEHSFLGPSFGSAGGDFSEHKMFGNRRGAPRMSNLNEGAAGAPSMSCRKYHMESDIFGTGMSPNHATHNNYESQTAIHNLDPATKGREMGAAGRPSVVQRMDWFGRESAPDHPQTQMPPVVPTQDVDYENQYEDNHLAARGNARENGGNPITGQGYKEEGTTHSKRRQFTKPLAAKLW